jgi:hypothetical protein
MAIDLGALGVPDGFYVVMVVNEDGNIIGSRKILVNKR